MRNILLAVGVATVALTACTNNSGCDRNSASQPDRKEVYTGMLPAADASGIKYHLFVDLDGDDNYMEGDYELITSTSVADSTAIGGMRDKTVDKSKGDIDVITNAGKGNATYYKLTPDHKKGIAAEPIYFLVSSDSTLTMVNSSFELPVDSAAYTLKRL